MQLVSKDWFAVIQKALILAIQILGKLYCLNLIFRDWNIKSNCQSNQIIWMIIHCLFIFSNSTVDRRDGKFRKAYKRTYKCKVNYENILNLKKLSFEYFVLYEFKITNVFSFQLFYFWHLWIFCKTFFLVFRLWLEKLNDFTKRSALDVSIFVKFARTYSTV